MIDYGLWAECDNEESLQKLKEHFHGLEGTLLTGREIVFSSGTENEDVRGLIVGSTQICANGRGIETLKDALETNEAGILLYHHLITAPDFRFAHIGWNAENQYKVSDLDECVENINDGRKHWSGFECVIDDEIYKQLGSPIPFWKFREGYWWQKFRGLEYDPLWSSDQKELRELCEQLLPDNFD